MTTPHGGLATPVPASRGRANREAPVGVVRRMAFGALLMVLVQAGIGMAVNLYVTVPDHHPGAHPADYLTCLLYTSRCV